MPIAIMQFEPSNARLSPLAGFDGVENPQLWIALGSAAVGFLASWLQEEQWTVGEYNYWMKQVDDTLIEWDKIGWSSGCWAKDPDARKKWLAFWARFSQHYKEHGVISTYSYVSDSEEKPARELLKKLGEWEVWFRTNCGTASSGGGPNATTQGTKAPSEPTDWGSIAKYAAYAVGGIVLLGAINTVRDATARR